MIARTDRDRTLALAGVFQAAELVHQAASQGVWSGYAAERSIASLFRLDADSTEDVFDGPCGVKLGLRSMSQLLGGDGEQLQSLRYSVALLQLEPRFRRRGDMQEQVGNSLASISEMRDENGAVDLEAQVTALGELYQDTISNIEPRIVVHGRPNHLKQTRNLNWIRALLLSGLRSAVLWRQLGGSRWTLLFGRKRLLANAQRLISA